MANPPRQKGTRWETELLDLLRPIFPHVERAPLKGHADQGDFTAVNDWLLEAKSTGAPHFLEWARGCAKKTAANHKRWAILWHGDRRHTPTELAIMPLAVFLELLAQDDD